MIHLGIQRFSGQGIVKPRGTDEEINGTNQLSVTVPGIIDGGFGNDIVIDETDERVVVERKRGAIPQIRIEPPTTDVRGFLRGGVPSF